MNNYKKLIFNKISSDNNQIDIIKKLTQIDSKLRFKTGGINTPFKKDSGLERKYESPVRYLQQGEIIPETLKKAKENQSNPFARKTPLTAKEIEQLKKYQKKEQQIKEGSRQDKVNKGYIDPKTGLATGKIEPDDTAEMLAEIALTGGLSLGKNVVKKGLQKAIKKELPTVYKMNDRAEALAKYNKDEADKYIEMLEDSPLVAETYYNNVVRKYLGNATPQKKSLTPLQEVDKEYLDRVNNPEFTKRLKDLGIDKSWQIRQLKDYSENPLKLVDKNDALAKYIGSSPETGGYGFYNPVVDENLQSTFIKKIPNLKREDFGVAKVFDNNDTNIVKSIGRHEKSHQLFNAHRDKYLSPLVNKLDELKINKNDPNYNYFNDATEKHAFIDQLRHNYNPNPYALGNTDESIIHTFNEVKRNDVLGRFLRSVENKEKLFELFKTLPAKTALPAAGIGYGLSRQKKNKKPSFQSGGSLSLNIIPKGVLHKNRNNIPKELGFGNKGIPVVYCNTDGNCEKTAEIESNELILTKDNSTQLDRLIAKHKNGAATLQDIGQFFKQQLMSNTHNNTKEFKHIKGGKIKV